AELCAETCGIGREAQDAYAKESYRRSQAAQQARKLKPEIVPGDVAGRKGEVTVVGEDEEVHAVKVDEVPTLWPVFKKDGTVTAANASTLNDGAAALVLVGETKLKELGLQPLARIRGYADAQQAPEWFTTAPAKAIPRALEHAGIGADEVDFYEINEAFSVV